MTTAEFFKNNPMAPSVLKVGEQLFLSSHAGAARDHAKRHGSKVEEVVNPNFSGGPDSTGEEGEGPDDTGENKVDAGGDSKKAKAVKAKAEGDGE